LFTDIETVTQYESLEELKKNNEALYDCFQYKVNNWIRREYKEMTQDEYYKQMGALYAEYGKIVCISVGRVKNGELSVFSFNDEDEKNLLKKFCEIFKPDMGKLDKIGRDNWYEKRMVWSKHTKREHPQILSHYYLTGHNIISFDIPYISKRCIFNGLMPPPIIPKGHLNRWEKQCIDTRDIINNGAGMANPSLEAFAVNMGIDNPKDGDVSGRKLGDYYYKRMDASKNMTRQQINEVIKNYCEKDIYALYNITNYSNNLELSW